MKARLIFKRTNNDVCPPKIEKKVVLVDIPIEYNKHYWCDSIEFLEELPSSLMNNQKTTTEEYEPVLILPGKNYISSVEGSARLTRVNDKIIISYRKGRKTRNQNTPNSVCISDIQKNKFFQHVRATYGNNVSHWQLVSTDEYYQEWNNMIDKIYEIGRIEYNKIVALG